MSESLEVEIEQAWDRLISSARAVTLYLSPGGRVMTARQACSHPRAEEVGRYDRRVTLAELREDVFHIWEGMRR